MSVAIENGDGTYETIAGKALGVAKFGEPRTNWLNGHTSAATAITADCDGILIAKFNSSSNTSSMGIYEDSITVYNQDQYGQGSQTFINACIPIRKGHKYYWNGNGHTLSFSFFYPFIENIVTPIESKDIYSTTETVVGQWIDGKPIYRKAITGILSNDSIIATNVDTLINAYGQYITNGNKIIFPYGSPSQYNTVIIKPNSTNAVIYSNYGNTIEYKITIEYTKTTN